MMEPDTRDKVSNVLALIDSTLPQFIDSFKIEMDYRNEAKWQESFAEDMRAESHIVVPKIVKELSTDKVIVMQDMKGDELEKMLDRYRHATQARTKPEQRGKLDVKDPLADADRRGRLWVEQAYGLVPEGTTKVKALRGGGFLLKYELHSHANPEAIVEIKRNGHLSAKSRVPRLTEDGMRDLRNNLVSSFVSQAMVHGLLHGDFHQGNFLVMGDGQTVAVLDYGQMVQLSRKELGPPMRLALAWIRKKPEAMASAMFDMTAERATKTAAERTEILARLTQGFKDLLQDLDGTMDPDLILGSLTHLALTEQLTFPPVYLQAIKTSFSMSGNLQAFGQTQIDNRMVNSGLHVIGALAGEEVARVSPHRYVADAMKERRVRKLNGE
jgi:predicted unusual protein kinase regulating ubiquinone biosynthesis (AarF/ABC1/UbiB family)